MPLKSDDLLAILGALPDPALRHGALRRVAGVLGCAELIVFTPDPELDVLLPVPGLPQTLRPAAPWREFAAQCRSHGLHEGELPDADGRLQPALGIALDDVVAIVVGECAADAALDRLEGLFMMLAALAAGERRAQAAEARAASARDSSERARALNDALATMRDRLEVSLREASVARLEAVRQAAHANALAEELRMQAQHLEQQAMELEMLNVELASRTDEAETATAAADAANHAKSEFLAMMSHELRTPINAVIGYAQLLEMGAAGDVTAEQQAHLGRIQASSRHLLTLVNDVLDLAKIEAGEMTVDSRTELIHGAVEDAIALVAIQAAGSGVTLEESCTGSELTYVGDEDRVRQILVNLLSNAVKFTEAGGVVKVGCGTPGKNADGAPTADTDYVCITVEDTGIGITDENLDRVFRPFVQAEQGHMRSRGGTGLGLTISRQLARIMGGDLTAVSEVGVGSRFSLWLRTRAVPADPGEDTSRVADGLRLDSSWV